MGLCRAEHIPEFIFGENHPLYTKRTNFPYEFQGQLFSPVLNSLSNSTILFLEEVRGRKDAVYKKISMENELLKYNHMTFVSLVMQLPWDLSSW